jgi:hypothetical protein
MSFGFIAIVFAAAIAMAPRAFAQPVSVSLQNGVHVRAPFTSVDVFPGGGVHVRAPYTAVDIGGRAVYTEPAHVVVGRPIDMADYNAPEELSRMDDVELWRVIRETSNRLMDRVSRFDTGATWQRYFRLPDELQTDFYLGDPAQREAAEKLLERFNDISGDAHFRKISDLPAFVAMRSALTELTQRGVPGNKRVEQLPPPRFEAAPAERSLLPAPAETREAP